MSAALAVRGDKLGWNQAHVMSESAEFACPVVRGGAGIHCNEARFKFCKPDNESIARKRSKLPQGCSRIYFVFLNLLSKKARNKRI